MLMNWIQTGVMSLDSDAAFIILGGEPFLDQPRLAACVSGARKHLAGEILVSTNGTFLSRETTLALASSNVTVQISLDSASPAMHDAFRGKGVFQRAIATAQRLVDSNVRTILSMVMTHSSIEEIEPYLDLAAKIGASRGPIHSTAADWPWHCPYRSCT